MQQDDLRIPDNDKVGRYLVANPSVKTSSERLGLGAEKTPKSVVVVCRCSSRRFLVRDQIILVWLVSLVQMMMGWLVGNTKAHQNQKGPRNKREDVH